jgi:hypothetical protein
VNPATEGDWPNAAGIVCKAQAIYLRVDIGVNVFSFAKKGSY